MNFTNGIKLSKARINVNVRFVNRVEFKQFIAIRLKLFWAGKKR